MRFFLTTNMAAVTASKQQKIPAIMQMRQLSTRVLQMNPPFCKTNHSFLYISLPSLHDYKQCENA